MEIVFLTFYHFLFWRKFYTNPYLLSTSEMASTNFPHWCWMGKKWQAEDNIYYEYPACIPFLSMFYWPNVLIAWISQRFSLDTKFRIYAYFVLIHYLISSLVAYKVMGLFGAITLTYAAYVIKPQTPSFVYTACWIPGMLLDGWMGIFSCFMAITGGYWPILVYVIPFMAIASPMALFGLIPALIQVIPFLWYWPKSIRAESKVDKDFGKIPWYKLIDLIWPTKSVKPTGGVHYPEVEMYMGIALFFIWKFSWWWIPLIVSVLICTGFIYPIQRIPARSLYLLSLSISLCVQLPHERLLSEIILLLQSWLLLRNASIYPSFPFSQWWDKPSRLYQRYYDKASWPHFSGYLDSSRNSEYLGGFGLKSTFENKKVNADSRLFSTN